MKSVLKAKIESPVSTRLGAPSLAAELANSHAGESFERALEVDTPSERRTDEVYEDRTGRQGNLRTRPKADGGERGYDEEVYEGRSDSARALEEKVSISDVFYFLLTFVMREPREAQATFSGSTLPVL